MRPTRLSLCLAVLALTPTTGHADFLVGRVVDANGVGIPDIDIDVKNEGSGGDPIILNDGTDAMGFFTTTVPDGEYRVSFTPPPPPITTFLAFEVDDVTLVGTLDMGVLVMDRGVGVFGSVTGPDGLPVSGLNLDVVDELVDEEVDPLPYDFTNAFGLFAMSVPAGPIDVQIKPNVLSGLAPYSIRMNPSEDVILDPIQLETGFPVTFLLQDVNALPLNNVDLDVVDLVTGEDVFTPGDNSNLGGLLDVILPAGQYEFEFCPPNGSPLAAASLVMTVAGPTDGGIVTLQPGVLFSGVVTRAGGIPVGGVDIDVRPVGGGPSIPACGDSTNALGAYSFIVPPGTYQVDYTPPSDQFLRALTINSLPINTAVAQNVTLSPGFFAEYCNGDGGDQAGCTACPCGNTAPIGTHGGCLNSAGRSASIMVTGTPAVSNDLLRVEGRSANGNTFGILTSGNNRLPANAVNPCFGADSGVTSSVLNGLRCVGGGFQRHGSRPTDSDGDIGVTTNGWGPPNGPPQGLIAQGAFSSGQIRHFQIFYREPAAALCGLGQNTTNAVSVTFVP